MENASDYTLWLAVATILTNIAGWLILKYMQGFGDLAKRTVVAVVALVISTVGLYYQGNLDMGNIARTWMIAFLAASGLWLVLWKPIADAAKGPPVEGIA